jgi:hypothetical protein
VLRGAAAVGAFAGEGSAAAGHGRHTVSVHGLPEDAVRHSHSLGPSNFKHVIQRLALRTHAGGL